MRNTLGSRSISSAMAWVMASMYVVSAIPVSILDVESATCFGRVGHGGGICFVGRRVDFLLHSQLNRGELVLRRHAALHEQLFESDDRILLQPLRDQFLWHVRLIVMFRVTLHAERDHFDERDASAAARMLDRALY